MAMGKRKTEAQPPLFIVTEDLPQSAGHPYYEAVNRLLAAHGFDPWVEEVCQSFYAPTMGRPSLAPGIYFRCLMVGYLEGIGSERGIAWRVADSLSLRRFLGVPLGEQTPDHSTISRTRRLVDLETHERVFVWVLKVLALQGLISGKTVGIDATTLEANAAMRSIVRNDTGQSYQDFLKELAKASGIETPTREDPGPDRPGSSAQGLQRRLAQPVRAGCPDRQDEGWVHTHGPQERARGGPDRWPGRGGAGGDGPGGRRRGHHHLAADGGAGVHESPRRDRRPVDRRNGA
jgi:transposase